MTARLCLSPCYHMMTSSNGNIFRVTGHLCGEFTGPRWIPHTKASDAELWCFLWSAPWINSCVNNREAGDLRRQRTHYDVIVMMQAQTRFCRLIHSPSPVTIGLSVGYETLHHPLLYRIAWCRIAWWVHVTGGIFNHFSNATDSALAQDQRQANSCRSDCARGLW